MLQQCKQYQIALSKVCNLLLMVVASLVPSLQATQRVVYLRQHFHTLACASCCFFYLPIFEELVPEVSTQAVSPCSFLTRKSIKTTVRCLPRATTERLVLMGKNLTTLLKADNIVCWIFRAIWTTTGCFYFHSLWNTYPSINDPGFNLETPWVIISPLHVSLLIWSAVWPLDD